MVCKITFSKRPCVRSIAGATLVENVIGMGIGVVVLAAVCGFSMFSARGFAGFSSCNSLDLANRKAMDQITKDFRMVQAVTNFAANTISMVDYDGTPLEYYYSASKQTLNRIKGGVTNTLFNDCTRFNFTMGMRTMTNATFDFYPTTNVWECKAMIMDWCCSRKLLGSTNDDMPQIQTVVMRN